MIKFLLGMLIGSILGITTMCLVTAAKTADKALGIDDK